jgi:beta-lactamase class D
VLSACGGGGAPEVDPVRGPAAAGAGFEDAEVGFGRDAAERVQHVLAGVDGTLVVRRLSTGETLRHAKERAATRYSPASTFKIPNTLIALETGVLEGPESAIPWDARKYPKQPWWDELLAPMGSYWDRDHTLASAFAQSVVWFYREVAIRVGPVRMQLFLDRFDYGNRDLSAGIDGFWLVPGLAISADEQVAFLVRYLRGELGLSARTNELSRRVFLAESDERRALYAKTGTGRLEDGRKVGWYVGFIERGDDTFVFAFNLIGDDLDQVRTARKPLARDALVALELL